MTIFELFFLALGLSMDAFAVSVCKGLSAPQATTGQALLTGIWFGGFQALMPCIGWILGVQFQEIISRVDHWIAFILLGLIGLNMILSSHSLDDHIPDASFSPRIMLPSAIATSIDALTVGITFAALEVELISAVAVIGFTTLALSAMGVRAGGLVGRRGKTRAQQFGGWMLIFMGCKILWEHLSFHNSFF